MLECVAYYKSTTVSIAFPTTYYISLSRQMSTFNPLFPSKHSLAVCVGGGQIKVSGLRRQNVPQMS